MCDARKVVAAELLELAGWELGDSVVKLVRRYRSEIEHAKRTGLLSEEVWWLLMDIGSRIKCHSQDCEGANNYLKEVCKRANWITIKLLRALSLVSVSFPCPRASV